MLVSVKEEHFVGRYETFAVSANFCLETCLAGRDTGALSRDREWASTEFTRKEAEHYHVAFQISCTVTPCKENVTHMLKVTVQDRKPAVRCGRLTSVVLARQTLRNTKLLGSRLYRSLH
jgi:hypothetical protein